MAIQPIYEDSPAIVSPGFTPLLENPDALATTFNKTIQPNKVTMVIVEGDSMVFGSQATGIATTHRVRFRKELCDAKNAHFGGSAKSGAGRFGPFYPTGTLSDVDGPIIIPAGSGWTKWGAGLVNTTYWTEMVRLTLRHPGSVAVDAAHHYAGCYFLFNPAVPDPGPAKWLNLLFNGTLTGTFKVQAYQGANTTAALAGAAGANRYRMTAGAFGGADVPDPVAANAERVMNVTIDPANYPDHVGVITGHLNAAAFDPTQLCMVCIYRVDNAATVVEINAFDGHYDEYTAQNTPRSDGAVTVASFSWPGDTDQGEEDGSASYGANSDYNQQGAVHGHMMVQSRRYIDPKFPHTMPRAILAISNEGRNTLNNVDDISGTVTPSVLTQRLVKETLNYAEAGIAHLYLFDIGASGSGTCWNPAISAQSGAYNTNDYRAAVSSAVLQLKNYVGTAHLGGGLTVCDLDFAFGSGGPDSYAKSSMFSSADKLHWNDEGQQRVAKFLQRIVCGETSIGRAKPAKNTRVRDSRTLPQRAQCAGTYNVRYSLDPNDLLSCRQAVGAVVGGDGEAMAAGQLYNGLDLSAMAMTRRGAEPPLWMAEGCGERAALFFDNTTNKNNRCVYTIAGIQPATTIIFILQNLWNGGIAAFPNTSGTYLQFGTAADDLLAETDMANNWSGSSIKIGSNNGLGNGAPIFFAGNGGGFAWSAMGDHPGIALRPSHDPFIAIMRIDAANRQATLNINPSQAWKTVNLHAGTFPVNWSPTRVAIGGALGTGACCIPNIFGGMWIMDGLVSDADCMLMWKYLQGESGNWFQSGVDFSNYGAMNTPQ